MTQRRLEIEGHVYELDPQPIRTSLTDGPTMLWGFEVNITRDGDPLAVKTCFVGRASVQFRKAEVLSGATEDLVEVLHELAFEKIEAGLRAGEDDDAILFA
ncbi:MAG: hypothetical protein AB7V42_00430 [Thermoleophilia bacterium]